MVPNRSMCLLWFLLSSYQSAVKLEQDPVILFALLKNNLLTILHPNIHRCPKDYMTRSKYSERLPLSKTNLVQVVMLSFRHQEIQLTNVQIIFYGCNFSEVI